MIAIPLLLAASLFAQTSPAPPQAPKVPEVVNTVEGLTTILSLVGEGQSVKKGQLVCELDSAFLRDKLANQQINVAQSAVAALAAKKALEVAEAEAKEIEVATEEEIKSTRGDIRIAELDIKIYKQKIEDAKFQQKIGQGRGELDTAVSNLARAEAALNRAQAKLKALQDFTKNKRKVEADANVKKALVEVEATKAIHDLEVGREAKFKKQIEACQLKAPADGRVQYANPRVPRPDGYVIEEGATVRERQTILRILPE